MKNAKVKVGDLVVAREDEDAAVFKITNIHGFMASVNDAHSNRDCGTTDISLLSHATETQIRNHK